ncbi:quinolinate synthase NadA [Collinsella vaginalis]|uniref:quinolinate synthase NadA n=1 Tax=Collinsella vaginalis TaxID=1870987 RepID=UPI000A2716E6|nr:quinolinate synthase NadA [Collinsella vaginalis]
MEHGVATAGDRLERGTDPLAHLKRAVEELKATRDAVILAHYYVAPEVQELADYVGDSFYLAKLANSLPAETIVLAGVAFMGESAKLLNPEKTVLLPEPAADCPMAHMVQRRTIEEARAAWGNDLAVVCYVNSTMEVKSWSDVCVTSSNAVKICSELPQRHLLFIPDRNLGRYVAEQLPEKHVILNKGFCPRHQAISLDELIDLKEEHPGALILAHPECTEEVLSEADFIGSTAGIISYAEASEAREFIIVTVRGVLHELERRCAGQGKRFYFTRTVPTCVNMDMITVESLVRCLDRGTGEVEVDLTGAARERARAALDRMLELAAR